jgi:hypothetical protein
VVRIRLQQAFLGEFLMNRKGDLSRRNLIDLLGVLDVYPLIRLEFGKVRPLLEICG